MPHSTHSSFPLLQTPNNTPSFPPHSQMTHPVGIHSIGHSPWNSSNGSITCLILKGWGLWLLRMILSRLFQITATPSRVSRTPTPLSPGRWSSSPPSAQHAQHSNLLTPFNGNSPQVCHPPAQLLGQFHTFPKTKHCSTQMSDFHSVWFFLTHGIATGSTGYQRNTLRNSVSPVSQFPCLTSSSNISKSWNSILLYPPSDTASWSFWRQSYICSWQSVKIESLSTHGRSRPIDSHKQQSR